MTTSRRIALLATTVFLFAAPLLAAEGEGAAEEGFWTKHRIFWLINLVVFLVILVKAAGPAVVRFLEGKQQDIAHALAEAQRQQHEAATMEQRIAAQIAELRREVEALRSELAKPKRGRGHR